MAWHSANGTAAAQLATYVDDRYSCASFATALQQTIALSAFDSQGFTVTTGTEGGLMIYGYIALKFNGTKIPFLQVINSPTAPATVNLPITGVRPEFALMLMSLAQAVRVGEQDADANGYAVGVLSETQGGSVGFVANDNDPSGNMLSQSFVDSSPIRLSSVVGTISHEGTVAGMANEVLSLNYSVATSPARKWILVGWGSAPSTVTTVARKRLFAW